jgi:hypothetical protein
MVRYLRTGWAAVAFLATPIDAPAVDLSMTSIYQGRPSMAEANDWALADRWTIYSSIEAGAAGPLPAQADSASKNRNAWSTSAGYTMLTRWSLKGEYVYVNFLDPVISDPPAGTTTVVKSSAPMNQRGLKIGGNYGF